MILVTALLAVALAPRVAEGQLNCSTPCTTFTNSRCDTATGNCVCTPRTCSDIRTTGDSCGAAVDDYCGGTISATCDCSLVGVQVSCNTSTNRCDCEPLDCGTLDIDYGRCGQGLLNGCIGLGSVNCTCPPDPPFPPEEDDCEPDCADDPFANFTALDWGLIIGAIGCAILTLTSVGVAWTIRKNRLREKERERAIWDEMNDSVGSSAQRSTAASRGGSRGGSVEMSVDDYVSALMDSDSERDGSAIITDDDSDSETSNSSKSSSSKSSSSDSGD